ncbi:PREDICTED: uncharacterized protein LOC105853525 isoform X2 [Condylura cristata]|uniref:uncharacterized protein LOC105853525 isoform X2 n=1 Tax=Condylura cristata TaxID=143302 RepID=UPI000642DB6F|nr:PREDICTED: uncharacterized protein LOC105853525 isoform X2 [Condylura cristata]
MSMPDVSAGHPATPAPSSRAELSAAGGLRPLEQTLPSGRGGALRGLWPALVDVQPGGLGDTWGGRAREEEPLTCGASARRDSAARAASGGVMLPAGVAVSGCRDTVSRSRLSGIEPALLSWAAHAAVTPQAAILPVAQVPPQATRRCPLFSASVFGSGLY